MMRQKQEINNVRWGQRKAADAVKQFKRIH